MEGEFLKPLVIGHSAKRRCFRNLTLEQLPVNWKFNKKAWMNTQLWSDWLSEFNKKMRHSNRKVLLTADNAPSHACLEMSNVKLMFFPPNTTSALQPLDQGIIQEFKCHYRRRMLRSILSKLDDGQASEDVAKSISVLDAINWIKGSVAAVATSTVVKCFGSCGFAAVPETPEQDLNTQELTTLIESLNSENSISALEYLSDDENELHEDAIAENTHIQEEETHEAENEDEDDQDQQSEPDKLLTYREALVYMTELKKFFANKGLAESYVKKRRN
jgi:hypothetical protein